MREDRDHYIIVLTLIPIIICTGLYVTWQAAGQPPLMTPDLPFPSVSLPATPDLATYVPPWLLAWWQLFAGHAVAVVPAVGFGIFMGIVGFGTVIDIVRAAWKRFSPRFRSRRALTGEEVSEAEIA